MKDKIIYYKDELNDDFANTNIKQKKLPPDYRYFTKNPFRRIIAFIFYHFIVTPIVFLFQKIVHHEKIVGRKKLKKYRKEGYFLYGNHTRLAGDAYTPALVSFPKKAYIITSPDTVSIFGIRTIVEDLGAVPVPTGQAGMKNFINAVKRHSGKNHVIVIYPEAHIWPYYTKIRPFGDASFHYPAELQKPVFTFTTVYKKRLFFKFPKTTVYIDGPFFANSANNLKQRKKELRDLCFEAMSNRSLKSNYEHVKYINENI